jgi:hypothetical protein
MPGDSQYPVRWRRRPAAPHQAPQEGLGITVAGPAGCGPPAWRGRGFHGQVESEQEVGHRSGLRAAGERPGFRRRDARRRHATRLAPAPISRLFPCNPQARARRDRTPVQTTCRRRQLPAGRRRALRCPIRMPAALNGQSPPCQAPREKASHDPCRTGPARCGLPAWRGDGFPRSHGPAERNVNGWWLTAPYGARAAGESSYSMLWVVEVAPRFVSSVRSFGSAAGTPERTRQSHHHREARPFPFQ